MSDISVKGQAEVKSGWTATTLKLIAAVCMFIDHFGVFVVARLISSRIWRTEITLLYIEGSAIRIEHVVYYLLRIIGRISFPLFCFFLVEGFIHTKSRAKYALRLFIFALISQLPFYIALNGFSENIGEMFIPSNIYYTLLIGLIVIWSSETLKKYAPGGYVAGCFRILVSLVPTSYVAYEIYYIVSGSEDLLSMLNLFMIIWLGLAAAVFIGSFIYAHFAGKEAARAMSSSLTFLGFGMLIADLLETDYGGKGVLAIFIIYAVLRYGYVKAGCLNKDLEEDDYEADNEAENEDVNEAVNGKDKKLTPGKNGKTECVYSEKYDRRRRIIGSGIAIAVLILSNFGEFFSLPAVFFIAKYNGERGKGYKYFFYAFYPAHIALIVLVLYLTGLI